MPIDMNIPCAPRSTIKELLPLFLTLLKDEFPEVRLNIISRLEAVNRGVCMCVCVVTADARCLCALVLSG